MINNCTFKHFYSVLLVFFLSFSGVAAQADTNMGTPLNERQLIELVSGNSIIGTTCHTHSLYELYFYPDNKLLFRKAGSNEQVYLGKWWVQGDTINSQWPDYKKKPTVNTLKYYKISQNTYKPYNVNDACGPAGTFDMPFVVLSGKIPSLEGVNVS